MFHIPCPLSLTQSAWECGDLEQDYLFNKYWGAVRMLSSLSNSDLCFEFCLDVLVRHRKTSDYAIPGPSLIRWPKAGLVGPGSTSSGMCRNSITSWWFGRTRRFSFLYWSADFVQLNDHKYCHFTWSIIIFYFLTFSWLRILAQTHRFLDVVHSILLMMQLVIFI